MRALTSCSLHIEGAGLESRAIHGTVDFPLGCYEDDLTREPVSPHWHDELEVFRVIEGTATFVAGSRRIELTAGDGLFVNAGVIHGAFPAQGDAGAGSCRLHTVVFGPRLVASGTESVFWQDYMGKVVNNPSLASVAIRRSEDWQRRCLEAVDEAVGEFVEGEFGFEFRVRDALSRLTCEICAHHASAARPLSERALRNSQRVKTMIQYIHDHYADDLRIEDVAASASVSVSECLRRFREAVGTTPIQYARGYRVRQAARLLKTTELRVSDVGVACGFREMSYFTRTFRAVMGTTPSEYRRSKRAG